MSGGVQRGWCAGACRGAARKAAGGDRCAGLGERGVRGAGGGERRGEDAARGAVRMKDSLRGGGPCGSPPLCAFCVGMGGGKGRPRAVFTAFTERNRMGILARTARCTEKIEMNGFLPYGLAVVVALTLRMEKRR